MHPSSPELIWIIICAFAVIRFWRVVLPVILFFLLGVILLGLTTIVTFFIH